MRRCEFVIVVVVGPLPVGGRLASQYGCQTAALHVTRNLNSEQVKYGGCIVDVDHPIFRYRSGLDVARITNDPRHANGLLIHKALVKPTMIPKEEAVIAGVNHDR